MKQILKIAKFKKNNNNIYALVEGITNYYHKQAMSTIGSLSQEPNIKQIIDEIRDNYNTDVYMIFGYYKFINKESNSLQRF